MALSVCETLTDLHDQELKKHGDLAFPIAVYLDDLSAKNVPWHWHDEWEFIIVHKGRPSFLLENFQISLQSGDGIFINGKALHAVNDNVKEHAVLHSGVFHPRLIGGNTDSIFWQELVQPFMANLSTGFIVLHGDVPWEKEALDHFALAWDALTYDRDNYFNTVRYELSTAVRGLIQHTDFSATNMSVQEMTNAGRIRTMLEYIEEHYREDITVATLATTIMVSESAALRCFHQMLHTTPMQYVKQLRIKKSADLLLRTNKSAKEIALDCGFNDISYYTKSFKEVYRMTPGEFRKTH